MRRIMSVMILMVASVDAVDVLVAETVELRGAGPVSIGAEPVDVRWSSERLVLHRNRTRGCRGRCLLQPDGALLLANAQLTDSGLYTQEVFNWSGQRISRKNITLTVKSWGRSWSKGWTPLGLGLLLVFIIIIIVFIRKKTELSVANQSTNTDTQLEENHYVPMSRARDLKAPYQTKPETEEDVYV